MKRIIAAALVLTMIIALIVGMDIYVHKNYKLDKETGVVTVKGELDARFFTHFLNDERVKSIVAEEGCVLPENCNSLFYRATVKMPNLRSIDLSGADTSNVNDACNMFASCSGLTTLVITGFDTSNITNMCGMFDGCTDIGSLDLSSFDTSKVTTMAGMFQGCESLETLDLGSFDTSNVESMSNMFSGCGKLKTMDLGNFDTSKVMNMSDMFSYCKDLREINLTSFDTSLVSEMDRMFYGCRSLSVIDMSSFDSSSLKQIWNMFQFCTVLETIYVNGRWETPNIDTDMFGGCYQLVGGKGWHYTISKEQELYEKHDGDSKYAKIDRGDNEPGFFTLKE